MPQTQEQRKADTRGRLLEAASELFAQRGYHAVSTESVAAAAGRTTGAVYAHFGGKEGLLVALLEQWVERAIVDLAADLEGQVDLDARLAALWSGVVQGDSESVGRGAWLLLEFELWLHAVRDPELGAVGAERFELMRAGLAGGLAQWSEEFGFALPIPAPDLATQFIALVIGSAFQHLLDPLSTSQAVVLDGLRRLLGLSASLPSTVAGPQTVRAASSPPTPPSMNALDRPILQGAR